MKIYDVKDKNGNSYLDGIKLRRKSWESKTLYTYYSIYNDNWYDNKQNKPCCYNFRYLTSTNDWELFDKETITMYKYLYSFTDANEGDIYFESNWTSADKETFIDMFMTDEVGDIQLIDTKICNI